MMFRSLILGSGIIAGSLIVSGSASAGTVLFEDSFDRGAENTVGNGWTEISRTDNDVAIANQRLRLRDGAGGLPGAAAASALIDATGYENITVSFQWRAMGDNEESDKLMLSYALTPVPSPSDLQLWTTPFIGGAKGGSTWYSETISLGPAVDNSSFSIMLWTLVSSLADGGNYEGFMIDDVVVMGDAISPVPLPASLFLLGGGAAALGAIRRRKTT